MKKETKELKKETDFEMLARLVVSGFEQQKEEFKQELHQEISSVRQELHQEISSVRQEMETRFNEVDSRLANIGIEQAETNRRLASLEKKQVGTILSLDETVHRNEFNKVVKRVEVLEKR